MAALLFVAGAYAETVTIDTAAGTTNRLQQTYSGEMDLSINPASTGGVVLPRPYSTYSGTTTLGSGTLVVTTPARDNGAGELGAVGPFIQNGGTLLYSGKRGGVWTRPITNSPASDTAAVVWQIDNDLTIAGPVGQPSGAFIKTGKGTLTMTEPFVLGGGTTSTSANRKKLMDLSPDRAPTQGYGPVTITDGTLVIDVASTNVNRLGMNDDIVTIGAWTTSDGLETAGVLIQSNGVSRTYGALTIGNLNGNTETAPTPLTSAVFIRGGTFYVGNNATKGGKQLYLGGGSGISGTYRSAPLLELSGPDTRINCGTLHLGYTAGGSSTVRVQDGAYLYLQDYNAWAGYDSGSAATTNLFEISGAGSQTIFQNFTNQKKEITTIRVADGGMIYMRNFVNKAGELHLVFDGGTWKHRNDDSSDPHFPATLTSVKIGPGGMTTYSNGGSEAYPVVWEKGIEPLDDSGTDGGLHITTGNALPPWRINAANTYCGPTEISATRVYLGKNGRLPSGTDLSIYTSNGGLIITNGITQTVGSFTFGRDSDETDSPYLGFGPNARLDVTGALHVGNRVSSPKFHLFETQGTTDALVTAGTYTFITAREEDFPELVKLSGLATFPLKPDEVEYTCTADIAGGRARLLVIVTSAGSAPVASGDPLVLNNTVLDETLVATAEQLAAARTIYTNPGYAANKHGPVELGALTGFAAGGKLVTGNGTTYASDLSFANTSSNVTIKFGTLAYTGGDATIPGFTLETAESRSAVLNVTNENTTLTVSEINASVGGLTKNGPGTLKLKPQPGTTMTLPSDNENDNASNGVTAYGDGPASGTRAVNVNEGWIEIGAVGDPTDAPDIFSPTDFSVGSQSHRTGIAEQTAGNLRMNNGTLYISSYLYIGYYCGNYASNPDLNLTPTLEQNGGYISCSQLNTAQCGSARRHTCSPQLLLHGGTNVVRGSVYLGRSVAPKTDTYRTAVLVDGGLLCVSNSLHCGYDDKVTAVDFTVTGNGRVEVADVFYPAYQNKSETNTFHLSGNGVVRTRKFSGNATSNGLKAYFDGGTIESLVNASGNGVFRKMQRAFIGAGGLNFDLSHQAEVEGPTKYWLSIEQKIEHDPDLGDTPDGGVTLYGAGTAATYTSFDQGTFTGPIRVRDGARLVPCSSYAAPFAVEASATARLQDYNGTSVLKDLTLGTAGATEPAVLELRRDVKGYGFVVTNTLSILSPVAVTTHNGTHDLAPYPVDGTYTALVYAASNADVDLTKFTVTAEDAATATVSAQQVTVSDGGAYDGMKAVVVTIAGASGGTASGNVWTSATSGGSWSVAANWANAAAGAPNGATKTATFNPATKANVGVTLDAPVTLGSIQFNAASKASYGYKISGQTLTLDNGAAGNTVAMIANAKGTNTIESALALATDAQLQTAKGNELRVTGGVSGDRDLAVNTHVVTNAGQVNLKVAQDYTGNVTFGSGRLVMDDLSFIQDPSQLTIGRGTFLYTGPDAEIPGFTINAGSKAAATFESAADVTVNAIDVGTSAFIKLGTGTLRLHGTGTFSPAEKVDYGATAATRQMVANGDGPTTTFRQINISNGTFAQGEVGDDANAPTVSVVQLAVGAYTLKGDATYELNNGELITSASIWLGYYAPNGNNYMLTLRQNGGRLTGATDFQWGYDNGKWSNNNGVSSSYEMNGGTASFGGILYMGRNDARWPNEQVCRFVQNDGDFSVGGDAYLAYAGNTSRGFMDLNGGVFSVAGTFYAARGAGNETVLRLNGSATMRVNGFAATAEGSTTRFYGNGGEFRPLGLTAETLTMPVGAFTYLYASTNGLVVNTEEMVAGGTYTVNCPVLHDPECEAETDGGLTKRGTGILVLPDGNTYLGDTTIEGGVLRVPSAAGFASGKVVLDGGAFEVVSGTIALKGVAGYGDIFCSGVTVTNTIAPSAEGSLYANGDVTLADGVTLDLSAFEDGAFSARDRIMLVTAEGTARAPETMRAAPASKMEREGMMVRTEIAGGTIYAVFTYGGTILMIR